MNVDYILRPEPTATVESLHQRFATQGIRTVASFNEAITVDVSGERNIKGKDHNTGTEWEAPLAGSIPHVANWLDIPRPFLERQDPDVQQYMLTTLLSRKAGEIEIDLSDTGIHEIRSAGLARIDPRPVIDVAAKVVGEDALVIDGFRDHKAYRFDVVVKDNSEYIGGDQPQGLSVGDLTKGGLRFGQDTQHRLAPWVNTFLYRLVCTNGMELASSGGQIDMRGKSQTEVIDSLEYSAREQMNKVVHQIEVFYDLRNKTVEDPYALIRRLQQEGAYPARMLSRLEDALPQYMDSNASSMFDIVNLLTNQANHADLLDRPNARRGLELAGGSSVESHASRCRTCQSVV